MDRKTANGNLFIILHVLVLFIVTMLMAPQAQIQGGFWTSFFYYFLLVVLPVVIFTALTERKNIWTRLGLAERAIKGIGVGMLVGGIVFAIMMLAGNVLGNTSNRSEISSWLIVGTIFAALAEEVLFRGFILPHFMRQMTFIKANIFFFGAFCGDARCGASAAGRHGYHRADCSADDYQFMAGVSI